MSTVECVLYLGTSDKQGMLIKIQENASLIVYLQRRVIVVILYNFKIIAGVIGGG